MIVVGLAAISIREVLLERAQRQRDASYRSSLRTYSQLFSLGMNRKEVESQLQSKGIEIDERMGDADLVRIRQEKGPWYCSEEGVYISLEFALIGPQGLPGMHDSDVLKRMTIAKLGEGCL